MWVGELSSSDGSETVYDNHWRRQELLGVLTKSSTAVGGVSRTNKDYGNNASGYDDDKEEGG